MTGIVLEGIVGSGKSSVLRCLKKYFCQNDSSVLFLSEHYTERPLEPLREAVLYDSITHLDRLTNVIKTLYEIENKAPENFHNNMYFAFERFHLSHCLDIAGSDHFDEYLDIDKQLNEFGCKLVVLTIEENSILERSVISTVKWRDEKWKNYLTGIAPTDKGIVEHYRKQQDDFIKLGHRSNMPSMVADASNQDWEEISFQVTEFLNRS